MNVEELKNKYTERAKVFQQAMKSCKSSNPMDCIEWFADRIAELEKDKQYFSDSLDKQIEVTCKLDQENAELKSECRRCVYTDSPCILSDYGKDKNGICDHFKNVFDEIVELKEQNRSYEQLIDKGSVTLAQERLKNYKQLTRAKKYIKLLLMNCVGVYESTGKTIAEIQAEAEQFIKEVEK